MPCLPILRQERFCQEIAHGVSPDKAYEIAGYSPNRANYYTLRKKPHIKARIAELLAEREKRLGDITTKAVEKAALTKSYVIKGLMENVERAMQKVSLTDAQGDDPHGFV